MINIRYADSLFLFVCVTKVKELRTRIEAAADKRVADSPLIPPPVGGWGERHLIPPPVARERRFTQIRSASIEEVTAAVRAGNPLINNW